MASKKTAPSNNIPMPPGQKEDPLPFDQKAELDEHQTREAIARFERSLMMLLMHKHWYMPLSCEVTKMMSTDLKTMGVTYENGRFLMLWNPSFLLHMNKMGADKKPLLDPLRKDSASCEEASYLFDLEQCMSILEHEFLHLLLDHIGRSAKYKGLPHKLLNVSADCAINQHLDNLPDWTCHPARMDPKLPADGSFEEYTEILLKLADKNGDGEGDPDEGDGCEAGNSFGEGKDSAGQDGVLDNHGMWGKVTSAEKKFASEKMKGIAGKVANKMAGQGKGALMQELLKLLEEQVNWRSALRRFVQRAVSSFREFTTTRPSRRDWSQPGSRKTDSCALLFAIDVSGSMSDHDINAVYADIYALQKKYHVDVDVCIFDDGIHILQHAEKFIKCPRVEGRGGTSFEEVVQYADNPVVRAEVNKRLGFKNRTRYSGLILYSDMYVGQPTKPKRTQVMFLGTPDGATPDWGWGFYVKCDPKQKHD